MRRRSFVGLIAIAALPVVLGVSGGTPSSPSYRFTRYSAPHVETVVGWMLTGVAGKALQAAGGTPATPDDVLAYFALAGSSSRLQLAVWESTRVAPAAGAVSLAAELSPVNPEMDALRPDVELLLQKQVANALAEAGLGYRLPGTNLLVPPVIFRFEALPNLLVVSPRDQIRREGAVLLRPRLTVSDAEKLEDEVFGDRYSVLVTQIGGLGVYPSMVPESSDIQGTLVTVVHEWVHHFFTLRPVGWRYALGAEKDGRMVTINETAAEILGREIGERVYRRFYAGVEVLEEPRPRISRGSSFRRTMRDVRARVDGLLAQGEIAEAESFMESSRRQLAQNGYFLRKLNQAYFAFHGSYADEPYLAGRQGEDIAARIHALRENSASPAEFAWRISSVGSYQEFLRLAPPP